MIATAEDARLLFSKWKDAAPTIRIKLVSSTLIFHGVGTVTDFAPGSLQLGGDSWQFTVPLGDVSFWFSDPREIASAGVREAESAKYEFGLGLRMPNGDELALMELRAASNGEPAESEE
jgi:hypothetical protein